MKSFLKSIFIIGLLLITTIGFIFAWCFEPECEEQAWAACENYCQDHQGCDEVVDMSAWCCGGDCCMLYWVFCNEEPWWGRTYPSCPDNMWWKIIILFRLHAVKMRFEVVVNRCNALAIPKTI